MFIYTFAIGYNPVKIVRSITRNNNYMMMIQYDMVSFNILKINIDDW